MAKSAPEIDCRNLEMTEIAPLFAVPFARTRNTDCAALHADLRKYFVDQISARANTGNVDEVRDSRIYESAANFFDSPDRCVVQLRDFCIAELVRVICQLNGYDQATSRQLRIQHSSWFRVVRRGAFLSPHNHPNSSWSGIYCVDPGHHDADKPDSGLLSFLSPAQMSNLFLDASNTHVLESFATAARHVNLVPGDLILFPSWIVHEVRPYAGAGERITVSFSCSVGLPGRMARRAR